MSIFMWVMEEGETVASATERPKGVTMLKGETILTGADKACEICGEPYSFEVMHSSAGFYIGSQCCVGPWTRESRYWDRRTEAELALKLWADGHYVGARGIL